jgi:prepilin-type N-terminal cleavage/methylation domain-containing protein
MTKLMRRANGFTMIEMLVTVFIFTVIAGSVFSLLLSSQVRYQSESHLTTAFQQANVAIDQITRDVHSAGYPPASSFNALQAFNRPQDVALPFAWSPSYPSSPCTVGATCTIPGDYDLILEADLGDGNGVQWIRYSLVGTTLMRGTTRKGTGDPAQFTALTPYLENVMNGPGNKSVAIFSYGYDSGTPPQPLNIREVNVCLIVQSAKPDPQTGQFRSITLTGQAVRFNPDK